MLNVYVTGNQKGQQLNAAFTQGDVVAWGFTGSVNGTPINLTGAIVKMTIAFPAPLELSTTNGGITITDAAAGQFTVNMSSSETADFTAGQYPYDLWVQPQLSPPVETQYITGTLFVNESITEVP